jgi:hypothetical protein
MAVLKSRLLREFRTLQRMVEIYCHDHHGAVGETPCWECVAFLDYAEQRLVKCPYGQEKPTCAKCPIHCYKRVQKEQARVIMRYSGPRMMFRHPWLALLHVLDKFRKVEHPMQARRRRKKRSAAPGKPAGH